LNLYRRVRECRLIRDESPIVTVTVIVIVTVTVRAEEGVKASSGPSRARVHVY